MNIILASRSATRAKLLRNAGLNFSVAKPLFDERQFQAVIKPGTANTLALDLAVEKSLSLASKYPEALIIGSDQILLSDNALVHKAVDHAAARTILQKLRGKQHILRSAVAVSQAGKISFSAIEDARITMRNYTDAYLDQYLSAQGSAILSSVGCYHFEAGGIQLMDKAEGSYFAILGLPVLPLMQFLRSINAVPS